MRVFFYQPPRFSKRYKFPCILTFGVFDGLHKGHLYLLKKLINQAKARGFKSLLISFWPHPLSFYRKKFSGYLTEGEERVFLLKNTSLDYFWILRFNKKIAKMRGREFIDYILKYFKIKKIIVGEDLKFGYQRKEGINDLKKICKTKNIEFQVIKKRKIDNRYVSSSLIRKLIKKAKFKQVEKFLGRPYSLRGKVLRGRGIGRRLLGFPTLNIDPKEKVIPPRGVYLTLTSYKGRLYQSISNLGKAPTLKKDRILLETHIINPDFNKDIYKDLIEIIFLRKIRKEKKFTSPLKLKLQITHDIERAKKFFYHHNT